MENPYQTPESSGARPESMEPEGPLPKGLVGQVRVVAILMMVQGGLELLWGIAYCVFAFVMPSLLRTTFENDPNFQGPNSPANPQMMMSIMTAVYVGGSVVNIVAGILRVFAGWRNYQFQGRILGMVANVAGLLTVVTCYCTPTAVALLVFALIVAMNSQVALAFEMAARGVKPKMILETFVG